MTTVMKRYTKGVVLKGETTDVTENAEGSLFQNSSELRLKAYIEGAVRQIVTNTQSQVLTNKTIDADNNSVSNIQTSNLKPGVLNTSTTLSGASNTQLPSALAVKTYIDDKAAAQNEASEISFVPVGTIAATNVQAMGQELDGDIQSHITNVSGAHAASAISNIPSGNLAATTVQAALNELQGDVDTRATSSDLTNHTTASANVHGIGVGNSVVGTGTSQALINKTIDADLNTISNIDNADIKANAGIDATKIADGSVSNAEFQTLDGVTSAIQTQLNSKVNASGGTLTNGSIVTPVRSDVKQDTKANLTTYALTATNGQLVFATDTKEMFQVVDTLLVPVGSGGGEGDVDTLFAQTFETAALTDFTQTGLVLATTNPLRGGVSARLTHQAAINQSFRQTIVVDEKFRGSNITLKLNIRSAAQAGNVVITVRDVTNSANLVTSEALPVSTAIGGEIGIVTFNIPATCASIWYEIVALPQAGSPVTTIDDIIAELSTVSLLSTSVEAAIVTPWQGYVPTFQGFGTPTNIEFEWRQVGENVEIRGKFVSGTPTAVEARVGLPSGLTSAGTSLIPSVQVVGFAARSTSSSQHIGVLASPSVTYVNFGGNNGGSSGTTATVGTGVIGSGETLSFFASIPCAGLTATKTETIGLAQSLLVQEADSSLRIVGFTPSSGATNTRIVSILSGQTIAESIGSDIIYADSAALGASFTVNTAGIYHFSFSSDANTTSAIGVGFSLNVSGAELTTGYTALPVAKKLVAGYDTGPGNVLNVSGSFNLKVGDVVRIHSSDPLNANGSWSSFAVVKQGSLKQLNPNPNSKITIPTSELRMEGASTRGSTATAIVRFDSIAKIRGDAFTVESDATLGTRITMRKKGKLDVGACLYRAGSGQSTFITRNQAVLTTGPTGPETLQQAYTSGTDDVLNVNWSGEVAVGDIIRICSTISNLTANSSNLLSLFFQEQDISVSVTNTLPQFSESDSSVRVDTANGYGSTGTRARRFSNVRTNVGTAVEYVPSAVNGDSWVIKEAGVYHISYADNFTAANTFGISLNASASTGFTALTAAERLTDSTTTNTSDYGENVSCSPYLNVGDVIRAHTDGGVSGAGGAASRSSFTISKVGKPNVTGVDVTPFVNIPQQQVQTAILNATAVVATNTNLSTLVVSNTNNGLFTLTAAGLTALKKISINASIFATGNPNAAGQETAAVIFKNGVQRARGSWWSTQGGIPFTATTSFDGDLEAGEILTFSGVGAITTSQVGITIQAEAQSDSIITANESFSTDTANLVYAPSSLYTLATLNTAPVGTFITFTYAANTNTRTQTTTAPTQTTADMNVNGIRIFPRPLAANSNAASPAAVAIQIGKGLKGCALSLYKSTGKSIAGALDRVLTGATSYGAYIKEYNESTGILIVDAGIGDAGITIANFLFSDVIGQDNGYLVINASKSPALTGVPLLQPRIATIKDVKASGTGGPTTTLGIYQTRQLNTLEDTTGIVTSLASNQFVLSAGQYYIEAICPSFYIGTHKSKLRNITDGVDVILGSSERTENSTAGGTQTSSFVLGMITISSTKTFEIQTRVQTTYAGPGFGISAGYGDNETYTQVKITRVR